MGHAKYADRKLTEDETEIVMTKIYKTMTKNSSRVVMDPFNLDVREMLTEDAICELKVGTEIEKV